MQSSTSKCQQQTDASVAQEGLARCDAQPTIAVKQMVTKQETLSYVPEAQHRARIDVYRGYVEIRGSTLIHNGHPIIIEFGPLEASLTEDQALAIGDALITAVHQRRSHIAAALGNAQHDDAL